MSRSGAKDKWFLWVLRLFLTDKPILGGVPCLNSDVLVI